MESTIITALLLLSLISDPNTVDLSRYSPEQLKEMEREAEKVIYFEENQIVYDRNDYFSVIIVDDSEE